MIIGGIAVIHYGHVRSTQDIDIILEDNATKFPSLFESLRNHDFNLSTKQFQLGYREKTNISIFDNRSTMRLDVNIADKPEELEVLENAVQEDILGNNLAIAPLEYVLIGKILYMGKIDDIPDSELYQYQDVFDFLTIYHANKEKINEEFLNQKADEYGFKTALKRLRNLSI
ncbi:MAG: hypothetical protein HWN65_20360 [Candidatus Helarchaeota archaeon]|nr:hypothetical protein [Candidatus Helarchaeota archaeon]